MPMHKLNLPLLFALALSMSSAAWSGQSSTDNVYEDGVTLTITTKPFDPKVHKIEMCGGELACTADDGKLKRCEKSVCVIDGKPVYGTYGKMPKQEVTSLSFEKNGKKIALDVSGMYDPNVNSSNIKKYVQIKSWGQDDYKVTGYFSHDDGDDDTYICLWSVWSGGSFRKYMGDFESLDDLATKAKKDLNYVYPEEIMEQNSNRKE